MNKLIMFAMAVFSFSSGATMSQPVPISDSPALAPQIEIQGVGVGTLGFGKKSHEGTQSDVSLSDSSLFLGAAERTFNGGIGSVGLGGLLTESINGGDTTPTSFFVNQAFVDYQTLKFEALLGRSDNPSAHIVDLPTLRGDDLITLTHPLNPYSDGVNPEEHRFANVASMTFNQNLTYFENIHAQHLLNSARLGSENGVNSVGVTVQYLSEPGLESFHRVESWGLGYEHLQVPDQAPGGLHQFYTGGAIHLNQSQTHRLTLRAQDIYSVGSRVRTFQRLQDSFAADFNSLALALSLTCQPYGGPRSQIALTGAFKDHLKVDQAKSYGGALTMAHGLGQGFDLVAQLQGQWRERQLAEVQSAGLGFEYMAEVGFVFNFDSIFNSHLTPRRSILNQQHQYVPN